MGSSMKCANGKCEKTVCQNGKCTTQVTGQPGAAAGGAPAIVGGNGQDALQKMPESIRRAL